MILGRKMLDVIAAAVAEEFELLPGSRLVLASFRIRMFRLLCNYPESGELGFSQISTRRKENFNDSR